MNRLQPTEALEVKATASVCLEIAIKLNEDKIISLKECAKTLVAPSNVEKFTQVLSGLEHKILAELGYKLQTPVSVDFLTLYAFDTFGKDDAKKLCSSAMPLVYFATL